jgi:porin
VGDGLTDPVYRLEGLHTAKPGWFAFKDMLAADYGLSFSFDYQALRQVVSASAGNDSAAGGIFRAYGSWTLFGQESGNTGSLVFKVENRHRIASEVAPQNLGFEAGALSITGTSFSDIEWALTNLYWQQRFADNRISLVFGQVDVTDYVDVYGLINPVTSFSNLSFLTSPTIAAPNQGLGATIGLRLSDKIYAVAGFADANGDPTDPNANLFRDFETFKHVEIGYTSAPDRTYFDNIHLTLWQSDVRKEAGVPADHGAAFSASWFFDNRWVPFLRAGISKGTAALLDANVSAGVGYLNKHRDLIGAAVSWGSPGDDSLRDQFTAEAFYKFQFSPNFAVTLDGQVIANPALNPKKDAIGLLGLRARVNM